jgi:spore coat polysaccharide biosynthesis predicted glycosyltransferase SpsG
VRLLDSVRPDLLVLDTPVASDGRRWVSAARRRRITTASIHDAGIAPLSTDLAVDGSLAAPGPIRGARQSLVGPAFMVVDPAVRETPRAVSARRVVIALGGGSRVDLARRIGEHLLRTCPGVEVQIAAGFGAGRPRGSRLTWIGPQRSLAPVLGAAEVAVVAGGITLYEAAALGVPAVAVAIVAAQRPTVRAFVRAGAALGLPTEPTAHRVAALAARLLNDAAQGRALAVRGRRLVDGRGTARVADVLSRLAQVAA